MPLLLIAKPILGLFVLILMHISWWIQICQQKFEFYNIFDKKRKILAYHMHSISALREWIWAYGYVPLFKVQMIMRPLIGMRDLSRSIICNCAWSILYVICVPKEFNFLKDWLLVSGAPCRQISRTLSINNSTEILQKWILK